MATEGRSGLCLGTGTSMSPRGTRRSPCSSPCSASGFKSQVSLKARAGEEGIPLFQESSRHWGPVDAELFPLLHPNSFLTESAMGSNTTRLFMRCLFEVEWTGITFQNCKRKSFLALFPFSKIATASLCATGMSGRICFADNKIVLSRRGSAAEPSESVE